MPQHLALNAIVVKDYDEAIQFYTQKLLSEDTKLIEERRWVLVKPQDAKECSILLAKAANERQIAAIGNQIGSRVFLFLHTDDFWKDYNN